MALDLSKLRIGWRKPNGSFAKFQNKAREFSAYAVGRPVKGGKEFREPLRTKDPAEAEKTFNELKAKLAGGAQNQSREIEALRNSTIAEAVEAVIKNRLNRTITDTTAESYRSDARALQLFSDSERGIDFKTQKLNSFTSGQIRDYQDWERARGTSAKTTNNRWRLLAEMLKEANLWTEFRDHCHKVKGPKREGQRIQPEDISYLYTAAQENESWIWALRGFILALLTGSRPVELRHIQWKHLISRWVKLAVSKTAAGTNRQPTIAAFAFRMLQEWREQAVLFGIGNPEHYIFPFAGRDATKPMARIGKKAWLKLRARAAEIARLNGDEDAANRILVVDEETGKKKSGYIFYDTRRTASSTLLSAGFSPKLVQAQIGQVDEKVIDNYWVPLRNDLDRMADALDQEIGSYLQPVTLRLVKTESKVNEPAA